MSYFMDAKIQRNDIFKFYLFLWKYTNIARIAKLPIGTVYYVVLM